MKERSSSLNITGELKKAALAFLDAAVRARPSGSSDLAEQSRSGLGFRSVNGIMFLPTTETREFMRSLVGECMKCLGTRRGNEKDIEESAWKCASGADAQQLDLAVNEFVGTLRGMASSTYNRVLPCYCVHLGHSVPRFQLGPVKIVRSDQLTSDLQSQNQNDQLYFKAGQEAGVEFGQRVGVVLAPVSWVVSVQASHGNVHEEAVRLIDGAVSFLRLNFPRTKPQPYFPVFGELEAPSVSAHRASGSGVTLSKDGFQMDGSRVLGQYVIDQEIVEHFHQERITNRIRDVFEPRVRTVGERVAQGLAWLTRGRQAEDKSDRFLFFFTAIEALLSSDDKNAPVVQTIARHASVILQDDPTKRYELAQRLLALYAIRSALVHRGSRSVSSVDCIGAQNFAESLYWIILERAALDEAVDSFERGLRESSYGLTWSRSEAVSH